MKSHKTIKLAASDVKRLIKDLGLLVVSMDRIGSTYYDDPERQAAEMDKYFSNVKAFKLLSRARATLSKAYRSQSVKADVRRLEKSAETMSYWEPHKRQPRRQR